MTERQEPREFVPHTWCIEYPVFPRGEVARTYIKHDADRDRGYAEQRAADLHGIIVPLFTTDRRKA